MVALVFHCCCFSMMKFLLSAATRFFLDTLASFNPCASSSESRSFFSTLLGYIADEGTLKNLTHMVVQTDLCFCVLFLFLTWYNLFLLELCSPSSFTWHFTWPGIYLTMIWKQNKPSDQSYVWICPQCREVWLQYTASLKPEGGATEKGVLVDVHWYQLQISVTLFCVAVLPQSLRLRFFKSALAPTRVNTESASWVSLLVSAFPSASYHLGCLFSYHSCWVLNICNALVIKCVK